MRLKNCREKQSHKEAIMPEQPDFIKDSTEQMVLIPAGEFLMGSADKPTWILRFLESMSEGKDEKPPHKVYLDAYYIDKYEVTNEHYLKFLMNTVKIKTITAT